MISLQESPKSIQDLYMVGHKNTTIMPGYIYRNGKEGLGMANYNVFKNHLMNDFEPLIIFEDDVQPFNYTDEIEIPDDADAVYLGVLISPAILQKLRYDLVHGYENNVYRVYNPAGTHAVLYISERYTLAAKKQASLVARRMSVPDIDHAYTFINSNFNIYAIDPVFCQNNPAAPEISNASRIISIAEEVLDPIF